jgi:hypothetical protein
MYKSEMYGDSEYLLVQVNFRDIPSLPNHLPFKKTSGSGSWFYSFGHLQDVLIDVFIVKGKATPLQA